MSTPNGPGAPSSETRCANSNATLVSTGVCTRSSPKEPEVINRSSRSTGFNCSNFGENRIFTYPDYFFCSNCDDWDTFGAIYSKRTQRKPCTAQHTCNFCGTTNKSFHRDGETINTMYNESKFGIPAETSIR